MLESDSILDLEHLLAEECDRLDRHTTMWASWVIFCNSAEFQVVASSWIYFSTVSAMVEGGGILHSPSIPTVLSFAPTLAYALTLPYCRCNLPWSNSLIISAFDPFLFLLLIGRNHIRTLVSYIYKSLMDLLWYTVYRFYMQRVYNLDSGGVCISVYLLWLFISVSHICKNFQYMP